MIQVFLIISLFLADLFRSQDSRERHICIEWWRRAVLVLVQPAIDKAALTEVLCQTIEPSSSPYQSYQA